MIIFDTRNNKVIYCDTQKNRLKETVLLSTKMYASSRNKTVDPDNAPFTEGLVVGCYMLQ